MNPNAKPFSFSAGSNPFVPTQVAVAAQPAAAEAPAPAAAPPAAAAAVQDSWDDEEPAAAPAVSPAAVVKEEETPAPPASGGDDAKQQPAPTANDDAKEKVARAPAAAAAADPSDAELAAELAAIAKEEAEATVKVAKKTKGGEVVEYKVHDEREHVNIVFIGHVDAGKSTISGQILLQMGLVDERTIAKYEKEAKEKNRDSWYLAYIMDTNEEERAKGKTVEVGRAHFATDKKRYTLLDAPGHKNYVPNMIGGAAQADVAILIISARRGEWESGFERGGQTREHAMLAKTVGVTNLIVAVNKMDEQSVKWSKDRWDEILNKLTPFLRGCGYKPQNIIYVPISGYTGDNIASKRVDPKVCPWLEDRRTLIEQLDNLPRIGRDLNASVRIPIITRYKDMGLLVVLGKIESGVLRKNDKLLMNPGGKVVEVNGIEVDDQEADMAEPGENVSIRTKGYDEEDVLSGFVLGSIDRPPQVALGFNAQLVVLQLLEHKPILTAGYTCVLHIHSLIVECEVKRLLSEINKKNGEKKPGGAPKFIKSGGICNARVVMKRTIACETFKDYPQLGRFTLRDEGVTIAIGKITKLLQGKKRPDAGDQKHD